MTDASKTLEERIATELAAAEAREAEETGGHQQIVLSGPPVRHTTDFYQFKFGFERLPVDVTLGDGSKATILYETLVVLNVMDGSEYHLYFTRPDREELERKIGLVRDEVEQEEREQAELAADEHIVQPDQQAA